ncbi:hypothetical protein Lser_V15G20515 [Lactuca serriola]
MAESSSVQDTSIHSNLLTIKPQQNLIIDLTPFIYEPYMLYVVECLKYSPLVDALTKVEVVPMSCLSLIYSTAYYDKAAERIHFDIHNKKTSISNNRFYALLGLAHKPTLGWIVSIFGSKGTHSCYDSLHRGSRQASKRGKKPEKQKEVMVIKPAKGKTPRKQKSDKEAPSQPKQKKTKKPAWRLILQSSSDSNSKYVPPGNKQPTPTTSESKSSDEEISVRGDTPPSHPHPSIQSQK